MAFVLFVFNHHQGLYPEILLSLGGTRFLFKVHQSFWNFTGGPLVVLPSRLSTFIRLSRDQGWTLQDWFVTDDSYIFPCYLDIHKRWYIKVPISSYLSWKFHRNSPKTHRVVSVLRWKKGVKSCYGFSLDENHLWEWPTRAVSQWLPNTPFASISECLVS